MDGYKLVVRRYIGATSAHPFDRSHVRSYLTPLGIREF